MKRFIRLLRVEANRTSPTMVAAMLGVSTTSVNNYLAGKAIPGGDVVLRAMQAFPALRVCAQSDDSAARVRAQSLGEVAS